MTIIDPKPQGVADWTLTVCVCVLAIPVLLVFGPIVLALRVMLRVGEK